MRPIYAEKCEVLSASLAEHSQDRVQFRQPDGGFFLWLECLDADARQVAKAAADEGLIFPLGAVFFLNREDDDTSHLRLAFSNASLDQLADAGRRLGVALQRVGAK
jgi:DNA-binding transcriptional MocR family regulator